MTIEVKVDHDNELVVARCDSETLTIEQLHDYLSVWTAKVQDYNELFIMTEADLSRLEFTELLEQASGAVRLDVRGSLKSRNAIVVRGERGERLAGFFQNAKTLASQNVREGKLFTDEAQARMWLAEKAR